VADAYVTGLRMLARRELSETQLRLRLERRQIDPDDIDAAIVRLRREGALDDRRTALAWARREAHGKRRGRLRVLRQIESLGIARDVAKTAVAEVFADVDERALLVQTLEKRLGRGRPIDQAAVRRVQRHLLAQGFEAAQITAALRNRVGRIQDDEER
jgi:regulatory protein